MAPYELNQEPASGILRFRAVRELSKSDAVRLTTELNQAFAQARQNHPCVRLLWDVRDGVIFSSEDARPVLAKMRQSFRPEDRTAILVASSLEKAQARQKISEEQEIFISESAARQWLSAWQ